MFFALAANFFYPIVVCVDAMAIKTRIIRNFFQQLAGAPVGLSFCDTHVTILGVTNGGVNKKLSFTITSQVIGY
jgi:hypothetical protein